VPFTFVCLALLNVAACSRTPPEPAPAATTSTAVVEKVAGTAVAVASSAPTAPKPEPSRCIAPIASIAPAVPPPASASACPPDPEPAQHLPAAVVAFPEAAGGPRVDVELAMNGHDVERGLMYRRHMAEDHGMLFKLGDHSDHTFWMQNTCIPLDMLFVDDDGTIVGIYESATPLTQTTRSVGCPSSFVLEVNAGWCRRHGVKPGQRMGLPAAIR
jgi:uncharacterized membrane protein (UPF0127 family)